MWDILITNRASKQVNKLPIKSRLTLRTLMHDLAHHGPAPGRRWHNYSKLYCSSNSDLRHCHLFKGHPTYVACWKVLTNKQKTIEVYYVGTHEKAPY